MSENTGSRRRKAISATIAVAMVGTMLLSGTLAYFYQSRATNTIQNAEKKIIGHDDFVEMASDEGDVTRYNKDIYVENVGNVATFVRVKLTEDFTLNGEPVVTTDPAHVHIPVDSEHLDVEKALDASAEDAANKIHSHFTWEMGGAKKAYISGKADLYHGDNEDVFYNGKGVAQDNTGRTYTAASIDADTTLDEATKADMKKYLVTDMPAGEVITMKEYSAMYPAMRQAFKGWVIDNSTVNGEINNGDDVAPTVETEAGDGWAYWSQMLKPGETTGLLLNGVTVDKALADEGYTYNINVDFEAVDLNDEGLWTDESHNTAENIVGTVNAEKIKTKGAAMLLETAKAKGYNAEITTQVADIVNKKEATDSEAAKQVYDAAIDKLNAKAAKEPDLAKYLLDLYEKIADDIDTKTKSSDPADVAYLQSTVLALKEDGTVDSTCVIPGMDKTLAKYIIDTYGDGQKLTGEQALSVTDVSIDGNHTEWEDIASVDGLNINNFPNLRSLGLYYLKNITTIDMNSLIKIETGKEPVGVVDLWLEGLSGLTGEVNLTTLSQTLRRVDMWNLSKATVKGAASLTNLYNFTIYATPSVKMTIDEINTLLANSPDLATFTYRHLDLVDSDKHNVTSISETDLQFPENNKLTSVSFVTNTITSGTIDFSGCKKLISLGVGRGENLVCKVKDCPELIEITLFHNNSTYPTIEGGVPNNAKITKYKWY